MALLPRLCAALLTSCMTVSLMPTLLVPATAAPLRPATRPATSPTARPLSTTPRPTTRPRRRLSFRVGVKPSSYRVGGFARTEGCPIRKEMLSLGTKAEGTTNGKEREVTLSDRPGFFLYLPEMGARQLNFTIQHLSANSDNDSTLYRKRFTSSGQAGFVGIVPEGLQLKAGETYKWSLAVPCTPSDPEKRITLEGEIQRTATTAALPGNLEDQAAFFADQGAWRDALAVVAQRRFEAPQDTGALQDWTDVMTAAKQTQFLQTPVVQLVK